MADLSPFFGNPGISRAADKTRKTQAKLYQDTWLDEVIKGFFGKEAAGGSVFDEDRETKVKANQAGQIAGIATDIVDPLKTLALLPLAGAIRLKGAKDLWATHAFSPGKADKIAKAGFLDAPSIGISARAENDYGKTKPQFVFAAGKVDPERVTGTLVNRDGYFANPTGRDFATGLWSEDTFKNQLAYHLGQGRESHGLQDLRLGQMWPGQSQGLAIAASPSFRSFKDFESSDVGAGALRRMPQERREWWNQLERGMSDYRRLADPEYTYSAEGENFWARIIKQINEKGLESLPPEVQKLWRLAQASPSAMAELKVLGPVPLSPADTAIHVPSRYGFTEPELKKLAPFRDQGFKIFNDHNLIGPDQRFRFAAGLSGGEMKDWLPKKLVGVPNPEGGFSLPSDLSLTRGHPGLSNQQTDLWNDFVNPGAGGSPPLYKAADLDPGKIQEFNTFKEYIQASGDDIADLEAFVADIPGFANWINETDPSWAAQKGILPDLAPATKPPSFDLGKSWWDNAGPPEALWADGLAKIKQSAPDDPLGHLEMMNEMGIVDPKAYPWMKKQLEAGL